MGNLNILDATIRDGGLVNNFFFTDEFVKNLYNANLASGVKYMEVGYKASADLFDKSEFGVWKFCEESDIIRVLGNEKPGVKLAAMADVGRCNFKRDICLKSNSPLDMIRVATYINTIPEAIEIIEHCHNLGYETTCNIMAISTADINDVKKALEQLGNSSVDCIYLVDSYGSLYPEDIKELTELYVSIAEKYGKSIGMHAHNNQQLAFANTIEAMTFGASYLDATVDGMGRGAGNCALELLLGFLKNPKYKVNPILKIIENHTHKLKEAGVKWGYDIPYMLTGQYNTHPRPAIQFVNEERKDYSKFANELYDIINS